jgi:hypothetical protein
MKSQPEVKPALDTVVTATTDIEQQSLRMGGLTEYAEAASTVNAVGAVDGLPVRMKGVLGCSMPSFPHYNRFKHAGLISTTRFNTNNKPPRYNVSMRDDFDRLELRGQSLKKGMSIWNMKSTGKVILFHGE